MKLFIVSEMILCITAPSPRLEKEQVFFCLIIVNKKIINENCKHRRYSVDDGK